MLGDYIKKLVNDGYQLVFDSPLKETDWMQITISKNGFRTQVMISPVDMNMSVFSIENILIKTIENIVGKQVLENFKGENNG